MHPYPAKLLPNIPFFFLNNEILSKPGELIVDPFCGSGTVLVEALLADRRAIGFDCNPIAALLSNVKTTAVETGKIKRGLRSIIARSREESPTPWPEVVNMRHWFYPKTADSLSQLKVAISKIRNLDLRNFFMLCFSACIRKVSLADPKVSVPVRLRRDQYKRGHPLEKSVQRRLKSLRNIDVFEVFEAVVEQNCNRIAKLLPYAKSKRATATVDDCRNYQKIMKRGSASLIITSPPYVGAQKYVRATSLSLNWLDFCSPRQLRDFDKKTIGREHYRKAEYSTTTLSTCIEANRLLAKIRHVNPLRAHIAASYLNEMEQVLAAMFGMLRPGGHVVLVTGNNQICDLPFPTTDYLLKLAVAQGFKIRLQLVDDIRSWGLMTKRNRTASTISREWVTILVK
ncbi:MAG: DNA methyltransferase [Chthoniobacter sp.]|uniref:DNA methyltransferase n=1 Tax=Chthoniobacter sp. TaxID=2510640 RepID=UPI0032ADAA22